MSLIDAMGVPGDDVFALDLANVGAHDDEDAAFDRWLASVSPNDLAYVLSDLAAGKTAKPTRLNRSA